MVRHPNGTIIKARRLNYLQYLVKLPKEEMLARFFYCQWLDSNQHDWTKQVRIDLEDFCLPENLDLIQNKSEYSWIKLVKKQAKEYELRRLIKIKDTKNGSKMKELKYQKLECQDYLGNVDAKLAKSVFKFRTRMAKFQGNFKENGNVDFCPLCGTHRDLQELSFQCPEILKKVEITEIYQTIFGSKISLNLAKIVDEITRWRNDE